MERDFFEEVNGRTESSARRSVAIGIASLCAVCLLLSIHLLSRGCAAETVVIEQSSEACEPLAPSVDDAPSEITIYITGAVSAPGVYSLSTQARIADAVECAGGLSSEAAADAVNLARPLTDGEHVSIPTLADIEASDEEVGFEAIQNRELGKDTADGKVNVNTASSSELQSVTGIGPSTAAKIIAERESGGAFATLDDLVRVSGIGEKKLAALRESLCV